MTADRLTDAVAAELRGLDTYCDDYTARDDARTLIAAVQAVLAERGEVLTADGPMVLSEVTSIAWPLLVVDHDMPDPSDPSLNYVTTIDLSDPDPDAFDLFVLRPPEEETPDGR